jgi:penicillin amidase
MPGRDEPNSWAEAAIEADPPVEQDPAPGFVAAANGPPPDGSDEPFLGFDWLDTYRLQSIEKALGQRKDWDAVAALALQMNKRSIVWRELSPVMLSLRSANPDAQAGLDLLRAWDGDVAAGSPAAAVFEFFLSEIIGRVVSAKAPRAGQRRPGAGGGMFRPQGAIGYRWMHRLVHLIVEQPEGWFASAAGGWPEELADALAAAVRRLRERFGDEPTTWAWGRIRPLALPHPLSRRKPLDLIFNLGPFPWGGDSNTIAQAGTGATNPLSAPGAIASLRMAVEPGAWDEARFVLPGGQSGNPLSPHYADMLPLWRRGEGVPMAWSEEAVAGATRRTLRLLPHDWKEPVGG